MQSWASHFIIKISVRLDLLRAETQIIFAQSFYQAAVSQSHVNKNLELSAQGDSDLKLAVKK